MSDEKEYGPRARIMRILLAILERPFGYTIQQLASRYNVSKDTISDDLRIIGNSGFQLDYDDRYRYGFKVDKPYRQLQDLLHFSAEDQALLYRAIESLSLNTNRERLLKSKLSALYDFRRLGHAYLRKPYLFKVNQLMQAKEERRAVILKSYRSSNSNIITDRLVEPFHISPPDDTLQAFDLEKKGIRHFKISRITRVIATDNSWKNEARHQIVLTDPFRIADNNQVFVHLRIQLGGYNELIERYPTTKSYMEETEDPNIYDFQCRVNHKFYGLANFMLGFHDYIAEVIAPESLRQYLESEIKKMRF